MCNLRRQVSTLKKRPIFDVVWYQGNINMGLISYFNRNMNLIKKRIRRDTGLFNVERSDNQSHPCPVNGSNPLQRYSHTYLWSYWISCALYATGFGDLSSWTCFQHAAFALLQEHVSFCSNNRPQLCGDELTLFENVNHAALLSQLLPCSACTSH